MAASDCTYIECSSPPCAMPAFTVPTSVDETMTRAEIMSWRKQERARLLASRMAMSAMLRLAHATTMARYLNRMIGKPSGKVVSLYWPLQGEPDLRPWATWLRRFGATVLLPVVVEKGAPLIFRAWREDVPLIRGYWNIPVPENGEAFTPDIAIAPVVGFDRKGFRLGYGGGYFDRTLAVAPPRERVIGVGYASAELETIRPLDHDIALSAIVTEAGVFEATGSP